MAKCLELSLAALEQHEGNKQEAVKKIEDLFNH